jgi:murein DD-endopeptidase MepM/ murein hydrolase activator NlpD
MMWAVDNRPVVVAALLVASLSSLAVSARLYLWPDAPGPILLPAPGTTEPPPAYPITTQSVEIKPGDNLVSALGRAGVGARRAAVLATLLARNGAELKKLRPGDTLAVGRDFRREPIEVRYAPSPWLSFAAVARDGSWAITRAAIEPDVRVEAVHGEVRSSLFEAIDEVGESPQLVLALVNIFEWDFDFTADTRTGDRFRLLVEKRYAGARFVDYGRILVAQYVSAGRVMSGVGFEAGREGRYSFYDPDGRSLKKSFLKSPLEFSRITSRFTYARPHPILGGTLPHLAVDYAAPPGTPIRAVADGTVSHAGWDGGYGLAVRIRHRSGYQTLYGHLSRLGRDVRPGARVNQRQVIGYVGSTGMSTGPHLHYEVIKDGRRVNPLGEKFIPGDPIPRAERAEFERYTRALIQRLETEASF